MIASAIRSTIFPVVSISAIVYGTARTYTGYKDQQTSPSKFGLTAVGLSLFRNFAMFSEETSPAWKALSPDKKLVAWILSLGIATILHSANIYLCCRLGDEVGQAMTHKNRELR